MFFRKSFLICTPSGSGKTLIGEICAFSNIFQDFGRSVYLVPFKALATEKYISFKKKYSRFNVNIVLSIGDYEVDDSKLSKADMIITTYEKMDSILRNFHDKDWIFDISTVIIDEIHMIGETERGPRLESLIVRLNEFLHYPQIIGLSATIANPQFFNSWLSSLGNETILIKSDERPVPLHYEIKVTQNKDSTIKKIIKNTLHKNGQVLIFLNKRRSTQKLADNLKNLVRTHLEPTEARICKALRKRLHKVQGANSELQKIIKYGVAFHHAGLVPKEKKLVEDHFRKGNIKVICCTTTLSAGINTPARTVILKDFKKFITSGYNIKNFSGYYERGDGFSYFKPFSSNEVFQMLGRAGRPGLDSVGYGIILAEDSNEKAWIEDHYFHHFADKGKRIPQYNDLISQLNNIHILKEQVLLRIFEEQDISIEQLKLFFEKTYFWYGIKDKISQQNIPIDQLLMIKEISPLNILKLHSDYKQLKALQARSFQVKVSKIDSSTIQGYVKTDFGVYNCHFDINNGIRCSCGFINGISDNYISQKFAFEFCSHVSLFLVHLIKISDKNVQKYVNDIIPKSVKDQYILNYLFEKGLISRNEKDTIQCSQFGKLIIRLYLYPSSGVLIRNKLEQHEINSYRDLIKEAYEVLKIEGRVRDYKMLEPIKEWIDEEPIDQIIKRFNLMTGDLYAVRDSIERIISFIGTIAQNLSTSSFDMQEKLSRVSEMAETLRIRVRYGIREDLFDLVLRRNVGRVRARILYNAGYHTISKLEKENPYVLNRKTGLGINICKKIIESGSKKEINKN
ncbi:MAG: DEAD/DEAH box helicase [Promethearchaeota archaeon]|nr:MAG: DEAD/DEAH box helicase [Candidatus Lokiarchaeota archaeon]